MREKLIRFAPRVYDRLYDPLSPTSLLRSWIRDAAEIKWLKLEDNSPQLSRLSFSPSATKKGGRDIRFITTIE